LLSLKWTGVEFVNVFSVFM